MWLVLGTLGSVMYILLVRCTLYVVKWDEPIT